MYTAKGKIEQNDLISEYFPAVRRQALALQVRLPASIELEDLVQAGIVGLLDARNRFDPHAGASFSTFASQRIYGAMIDELRTRDWLPRSARRNARAMETCIRSLEQRLGYPPDARQIADEMNVPLEKYWQLLGDTNNGLLLSLDDLVEEGYEPEGAESGSSMLYGQLHAANQRASLKEAIDALPEREKQLLTLYYQEELNLKEIGAVLGVSESRVCQLHSQAVTRLRARLVE